ncbi:MAG: ABC transporter substrate-binding protein [Oscillospiraceae bacterium]|nr:ABC transporter substrate-binding protein [Oscillospiraceae bacterium]
MKRLILLLICICIVGCSNVSVKNFERNTIASVYAVTVPFIVALDLTDRVLAINVKSRFWTDACENLAVAGSVGRGMVDLEALAKFAPDVLIHRSNDTATVEAVTGKLGIPVLCITVENYDDIIETLTIMGEYFDCGERAKQVCEWLSGKFEIIDAIVASIPDNERVTALMMGGELGRIAGGDMIQSWMIKKAGGNCVASDITNNRNWTNIGVETVFKWNPDYIFCTSSTPLNYTVDGILNDPAWSAMTAVNNSTISIVPAAIDSWDMPGISCTIGTMYMLYRMYPDYFSAEKLQQEIDEYYTFMFGKTFDNAYLGYNLYE